jgi:hypothetical protein
MKREKTLHATASVSGELALAFGGGVAEPYPLIHGLSEDRVIASS